MKNLIVTILLLVGNVGLVSAQDISFGVKGGVNFSNLVGSDIYGGDSKTGWTAGVVLELELSDKFSIQPELLYSAQGAKSNFSFPNDNDPNIRDRYHADIKLDYINLPIYAKYYLVEGLSIDAGPQFAFLVDNSIEIKKTVPLLPDPVTTVTKTDLSNKKAFGIDGSVGFGYKAPEGIFIHGRYNFGLIEVESNENAKNSVFQVSIGYEF
ncbi:porin family protein [Aureivirga sp. CE67]|uniref:porin family protein n=1 Tax=Aureivirga sp. CE67 TaxID=1788983 RepID=UPI0018CA42FB|nr:porin family protein [Aureivirga sp. CE67]